MRPPPLSAKEEDLRIKAMQIACFVKYSGLISQVWMILHKCKKHQ